MRWTLSWLSSSVLLASCWQLSTNENYVPPDPSVSCPSGQARESYGGTCVQAVDIPCADTARLSAEITIARRATAPTLLRLAEGCTYSVSEASFYWGGPTAFDLIQHTVYIEGQGSKGARIVRQRSDAAPGAPSPGPFRFFTVDAIVDPASTNAPKLVLINVELANGMAQGGNGGDGSKGGAGGGGGGFGGAILSMGSVVLDRVTLLGNLAQGGNGGTTRYVDDTNIPGYGGGGGGGMGGHGANGNEVPFGIGGGGGGGFQSAVAAAGGAGSKTGEGGSDIKGGITGSAGQEPSWDRKLPAGGAASTQGGKGGGGTRLGGRGGACGNDPTSSGAAGSGGGGGGAFVGAGGSGGAAGGGGGGFLANGGQGIKNIGTSSMGAGGGAFGGGGGGGQAKSIAESTNGGGGGGGGFGAGGGGAAAGAVGGLKVGSSGGGGGGGFGGGGGGAADNGNPLVQGATGVSTGGGCEAGTGGFGGGGGGTYRSEAAPGQGGFGGGAGGKTDGRDLLTRGGGGMGAGGAVFALYGDVTLRNCTLADNRASGGSGENPGAGYGGAIFSLHGQVTVHQSSFLGNSVESTDADRSAGAAYYGMAWAVPPIGSSSAGVATRAEFQNNVIFPGGGATDIVLDGANLASRDIPPAAPALVLGTNLLASDRLRITGSAARSGTQRLVPPQATDAAARATVHDDRAYSYYAPGADRSDIIGAGDPTVCEQTQLDQRGRIRPAPCSLGAIDVAGTSAAAQATGCTMTSLPAAQPTNLAPLLFLFGLRLRQRRRRSH